MQLPNGGENTVANNINWDQVVTRLNKINKNIAVKFI